MSNNQRVDDIDSQSTLSLFTSLITSFRLFQEGGFGIDSTVNYFSSEFLDYSSGTTGLKILGFESYSQSQYLFNSQKLAEFIEFYRNYPETLELIEQRQNLDDPFTNIRTSFRRFNYSYQRIDADDTIIDLAIAMEAFFSKKKDPKDSVTHRLSLRSSRLLTQDQQNRKSMHKRVQEFYAIRSSIVHGDVAPESFNLIENNKMVRSCITKYLDLVKNQTGIEYSHDSIINEIEFNANDKILI
ncbi:hypothetical protein [Candidatus Nitrosocosmicus sp. R]